MPRLGEILVACGLVRRDQIEQALRAQVVQGGRLGTNLVEQGAMDLDDVSVALGRQHGLPAALARHFERADPALQRRLDPELADRFSTVPLLLLADGKLAIASLDPLDAAARAALAGALGVAADALVASISAEQRIRYQLERVYDLARTARYLRPRGRIVVPELSATVDDGSIDIDLGDLAPAPPAARGARATTAATEALAALIDAAASASAAEPDEPARDRRSYVRTLAEPEAEAKTALGRIAIRRVSAPPAAGDARREEVTLADAAKEIRRARDRDRVAELALAAILDFSTACDGAALLVVRGDTAIAWKSARRAGGSAGEIAVPIAASALVGEAMTARDTARRDAGKLGDLDRRLLGALGGERGLAVLPLVIGDQVLCVIAAAIPASASLHELQAIATATATALSRLIRASSR